MLPGWYLPPTLQGQLGFFISSRKAGRVKHKALANTYWANYPYSLILIHRVVWKTLLLDGNPYMQREYRVGCSRRVSYFLCRGCFEVLPFVGWPFCGQCGAPAAFEVFGCDECRDKGFAFDGTQAPLRYEGMGEEPVHALKRCSLRVVAKVMAPLMSDTLGGGRFDVVVPVSLHCM